MRHLRIGCAELRAIAECRRWAEAHPRRPGDRSLPGPRNRVGRPGLWEAAYAVEDRPGSPGRAWPGPVRRRHLAVRLLAGAPDACPSGEAVEVLLDLFGVGAPLDECVVQIAAPAHGHPGSRPEVACFYDSPIFPAGPDVVHSRRVDPVAVVLGSVALVGVLFMVAYVFS